jgi:hypothetical protein
MKLEPGMGRSKSPFHSSAGCISGLHQRFYLLAHALSIRQPPVQTLARQDGEFYLRHIQPTRVLRRGMKLHLPRQPSGFLRREGLIPRSGRMGVQVVQHHPDHLSFRKGLIHQPLHLLGKVVACPPLRHVDFPPARQGLKDQKQVAASLPLICVVHPLRTPRLHRQGRLDIRHQLRRPFVTADDRSSWVVRFGVPVQPIFHAPEEVRSNLSKAPLLLLPGLKVVFFNTRRTVSSEMDSTTPSSTSRSAKSCIVQCSRPSGGALQARATRKASCLPSSLGCAPGRGRSCRAASNPSSANRLRMFRTVWGVTWSTSAIKRSVFPAAERSRMRARVSIRALAAPCLRKPSKCACCSSVKITT